MYLATALMILVVRVGVTEEEKAKTDLTGTYKVVACEKDGKEEDKDRLKGMKVKITKTDITVFDANGKKTMTANFVLNPKEKPWAVELTLTEGENKGDTLTGIIEQADERVRLCVAEKGGKKPTAFKAGEKQKCLVLEKDTEK